MLSQRVTSSDVHTSPFDVTTHPTPRGRYCFFHCGIKVTEGVASILPLNIAHKQHDTSTHVG